MRIEVKVEPNFLEPKAVIYTPKITPEVMAWIEMLERAEVKPSSLMAKKDSKIFIIEPKQIEIIRTDGGNIKLYNREAQEYIVTKPLHEIQEWLGSSFIRISKSSVININRVDHISQSFNTSMHIVMKNGVTDYISRKYWADFKKLYGM